MQQPPGAHKMLRVIAGFQTADTDTIDDTGMEEPAAANVQSHMGDKFGTFLRVVEEYKVAGQQGLFANGDSLGKLTVCRPGDGESAVMEYIFHQSGTVKSPRLLPAVDIGLTQLGIGTVQDPATKLLQLQCL